MGKPVYIRLQFPEEYMRIPRKEVKVGLYDFDDKPQQGELRYKVSRMEMEG